MMEGRRRKEEKSPDDSLSGSGAGPGLVKFFFRGINKKLLLVLVVLVVLLTLPVFSLMAPLNELDDPENITVWVTAYSSSLDETDSTPFLTAAQTPVRDGVVAANFLSFGTVITIPEYFGDKQFVVEDRLHPRKKYVVDVWMGTKKQAKEFGSYLTDIRVISKP